AQGVSRCAGESTADRARADRQRRDRRARNENGRHRRRALGSSRADQGIGFTASRHRADQRAGAALRARALPRAAEVDHRRPRLVHAGIQPLRSRAADAAAEADRRAQAGRGRGVADERVKLEYRACPKCGHTAAAGTLLVDECPACGVLFRKLFASPNPAPSSDERDDSLDPRWWTLLLETPDESRRVRTIAGALLLLVAAWYAWKFLRFDVADPES